MGFKFGGQTVLTDLILYLDASNKVSYSGTGNIWFDISGFGNHFNLQNNPTNNGLFFSFNGTNQWAQCNNITCGNFGTGNFTIEYVVSFNRLATPLNQRGFTTIIGKRIATTSLGGTNANGWVNRIGSNEFFIQDSSPDNPNNQGIIVNNSAATFTDNTIMHVVQTLNNNGTIMTGRLYRNSTLLNTSTLNYITAYGINGPGDGSVNNSSNIWLSRAPGVGTYLQSSIYFVRLYNKELSSAEILYNYNSIRGKYGI